ncbi:MAG TPA: sulfotransferase [Rhizomicrobium sp.]|jgi:tetratricopeptide (TPR) repeat protein|nr:sulfotransferase [Rhizomicrobium sp.]
MTPPASRSGAIAQETPAMADRDIFAVAAAALGEARPIRKAKLRKAAEALGLKQFDVSERMLSDYLARHPHDPGALQLMARTAYGLGQKEKAAALYARCLDLEPDFAAARYDYANTLFQLNKPPLALMQLDELLESDPHSLLVLDLKAIVLSAVGRHSDSLALHRQMVQDHPGSPEIRVKYGWSLKGMGLREEAVAAFRKAIEIRPHYGEAWWSLADLKTYRFSESEIQAIQHQLSRAEVSGDDRMYLHFTLGKAYGDAKLYAKSFENYARANAIKRLAIAYDPGWLTRHVAKCRTLFTGECLQSRADAGCRAPDPIFIIGMQRAGSTLVEQILASHPTIDGTAELPDMSLLAEHIGEQIAPKHGLEYPDVLARLDAAELRELGARYLETTRFRRTSGRKFFTDKMPYNFLHVGLIQLILPNARIVDVRRHPLGCCFSNFSMNFKFGALFAYRLGELGRAYADYVELMAHFDAVLPDRVHRVFYEELVRDPETDIRRLLDYIGLPFDDACLRFHENARAMDSVSSEQVRRPISADAIDTWRNYEPWLGPLKSALGPVLDAYPGVPLFPARGA